MEIIVELLVHAFDNDSAGGKCDDHFISFSIRTKKSTQNVENTTSGRLNSLLENQRNEDMLRVCAVYMLCGRLTA